MKNLLFTLALFLPLVTSAQELSSDEDIPNRYSYTSYHWNKYNLSYYIYNTSSHLTSQERKNAIETALNKWSLYTSFTFVETTVPTNADIVFMWVKDEHGDNDPFGPDSATTAHMKPEHTGYTMTKANIHYNDYKNWVVKVVPDNNEIDLVHTTLHEVGHALGLDHSILEGSVMYQGKREGRDLYYDDLQGIWTIYGCPFTIEGPSTVCSSALYFISSLPNKLSVVYSASGALTEISPIGSLRYLVEKNSDGVGCISASIRYDYTINTWTISKENIGVGTPILGSDILFETATGVHGCWASNMINNTFTVADNLSCAYDRVEAQLYRMDNNFNPTQLVQSWYNISTTNAQIEGYSQGWYLFRLRGYNDCGDSGWLEQEVEMVDFSLLNFLVDYDSSSEILTITLIDPSVEAENSQSRVLSSSYDIQIWNSMSMVKSQRTDLSKYQLSLVGLPSGIYVVRIIMDGKTYSRKFVKR